MKKLFLSIIALAHFGAQAQWTNVPSNKLTDISVGSATQVVGTNPSTDKGYWLNTTTGNIEESVDFTSLAQVSIAEDGTLWAVYEAQNGLPYNIGYNLNFNGTWSFASGQGNLANLSSRSSSYMIGTVGNGLSANPNVYYTTDNGTSYSLLPGGGALIQVSVGTDGALYGTYGSYTGNNTYRYTANNTWDAVPVLLNQISVGDAVRIVGRFGGTPYWLDVSDNTLHALSKPNGQNVIDIEVATDGTIYAITNEAVNNVYRTSWSVVTDPACQPLASGTVISGPSQLCAGETATFTAAPVSNATSYTWTLSNGWTGSSTTNTIQATASATGGQQLALTVTANNDCFTGSPASWSPIVIAEPAPLVISASLNGCAGSTGSYSATPANGGITWTYPNGWSTNAVYPNQNGGVFTQGEAGYVVFTKTNACFERSDSVYVNVYQSVPTAPILVDGQEYLCMGEQMFFSYSVDASASSHVFNFSGANSGWAVQADADTSIYITPQQTAGPYSLTITSNNTCGGTSTVLSLTANQNATSAYASFQQIGADLVANEYNGVITHQWVLNGTAIPGATSSTYTPLVSGDYALEVTFVNFPCAPYTTPSQNIEVLTVGVNEAATSNMSIYPNPFNTEFVIETTEMTTISVMNAMGEVVLSRTINGRTSIDATQLSAGIYFVREETSGVVMKLVKN